MLKSTKEFTTFYIFLYSLYIYRTIFPFAVTRFLIRLDLCTPTLTLRGIRFRATINFRTNAIPWNYFATSAWHREGKIAARFKDSMLIGRITMRDHRCEKRKCSRLLVHEMTRRRRSSHAGAAVTYRACDTCIMRLRPSDTCHMTGATRGVRRRGMPRREAAGTRGKKKKKLWTRRSLFLARDLDHNRGKCDYVCSVKARG